MSSPIARKAVELRLAGVDYGVIATQLGYATPAAAQSAVQFALDAATVDGPDAARQQEISRLDAMLTGVWPKARRGDPASVDRVMRLTERRADLTKAQTAHRPPCPGPGAHLTQHGHPSCTGHVRESQQPEPPGKHVRVQGMPCTQAPMRGTTICRMHGGNGRTKAKAAADIATAKAAAKVALFGARRDVAPDVALLELVQWTAGEVDYWRQEVRLIERDDLTWGVTREKSGGEDFGTTTEAKPHIAYTLLVDAQNRLATYCVAALKAGIAERQVRISEQQGLVVAGVLRAVLGAMLTSVMDTLRGLGVSDAEITDALRKAWSENVSVVVPRELRRLTEGVSP